MPHSILRPGFMVSLKTAVKGGVSYQRVELDAKDASAIASATAQVARWETTKIVEDPAEHERANKVRNTARGLITRHCVMTAFGLLCPESREPELLASLAEARALVAEHNATATCTNVSVYVMSGKIAETDEENARAIGEEIRGLIQDMSGAIDRLDPEKIREAAQKASKISAMLAPEQSAKVGAAVTAARKAARDITRRILGNAEPAAVVLADIQRGAIEHAKIAFLDFSDDAPAVDPADVLPAVDLQRIGGLDLSGDQEEEAFVGPPAPPSNVRTYDFGGLGSFEIREVRS